MTENLNEKDKDGMTWLHLAARDASEPEILSRLIALGADTNARNNHGLTPLHLAAGCNPSLEVSKCLLENGADIQAEDENGCTPLDVSFRFAKSDEVGIYFLDLMLGRKGVELTDPARRAEIERHHENKTNDLTTEKNDDKRE